VLEHVEKFGIYLNIESGQVVRITSPYWFPPEPDWVIVTREVNATLIDIRDSINSKKLFAKPESVVWGRIPLKD
tara:strand:+ start:983 stop:1204 length:222 start_codon:yes stop_codon:yes gene_type:complete